MRCPTWIGPLGNPSRTGESRGETSCSRPASGLEQPPDSESPTPGAHGRSHARRSSSGPAQQAGHGPGMTGLIGVLHLVPFRPRGGPRRSRKGGGGVWACVYCVCHGCVSARGLCVYVYVCADARTKFGECLGGGPMEALLVALGPVGRVPAGSACESESGKRPNAPWDGRVRPENRHQVGSGGK